jgi:hypothetical protein
VGEPLTSALRVLHVGGGWIGFAAAVIALFATKGGRPHTTAIVLVRRRFQPGHPAPGTAAGALSGAA